MTSLAHNPTNDTRFDDLMREVGEIARVSAKASRSKAVLAGRVLKATIDGVLDTTKDKHGKGIDDAKMVYDKFTKAYSSKDPNEHTPKGVTVQTSRLRKFIVLGQMKTIDPAVQFSRWSDAYTQARALNEGKDVRPEFEALYACAVDQTSAGQTDSELTDEIIQSNCAKPTKDAVELADWWARKAKEIEKIVTGENGQGLKDQSQEAINIQAVVAAYAGTLCLMREEDQATAKLAEIAEIKAELAAKKAG